MLQQSIWTHFRRQCKDPQVCSLWVQRSTLHLSPPSRSHRSLDKMNTYKSRIHSVVRGSSHWTGHTYLSPSITKRGSPGSLGGSQGRNGEFGGGGAGGNPLTSPVTVYDAVSILPIDPTLARMYRCVATVVVVVATAVVVVTPLYCLVYLVKTSMRCVLRMLQWLLSVGGQTWCRHGPALPLLLRWGSTHH